MGWTLTPFAVVVLVSAAVAIAVGIGAFRQRPEPLAWPLTVLMFAVAAWAIPHAISFGYTGVGQVAFWHRLRYPGTVTAPVTYLVIALGYAGYERWLSRRVYAALAVVPVITVVAVWTNPYHGLFWQSLSVATVDGASVLLAEFGPWYWVDLAYLYLVTVVGLALFAASVFRSGPVYRKQAVLMFLGGLVPLIVNGLANFGGGSDPTVDLTTAALAVTGVCFALALFYMDLLEVRPVARSRLVEELDDGVVVVGPNGLIRDLNPTAARVLDNVTVGQPADEVFPAHLVPDGGEFVVEVDGTERTFRTRSTGMTDGRGREIGRIVYLNDVTDLVTREQRVSVLNRILRHNIRNELDVISGSLEVIEERPTADEQIETAKESARRVIRFAEKARHVERTLRESDVRMAVPAAAVAERVAADAREEYPDATIEYEPPSDGSGGGEDGDGSGDKEDTDGDADVRVVDEELFTMALAELVENAVVHNDREARVSVRVEPGAEWVTVSVVDNGPGIPESEREIAPTRTESELEHASGLGLWLVRWFASLSGGDLSFAADTPRGSVVALTLAAAEGAGGAR